MLAEILVALEVGLGLQEGGTGGVHIRLLLGELGPEHGIVKLGEKLALFDRVAFLDQDFLDREAACLGADGDFLPGADATARHDGAFDRPGGDLGDGDRQGSPRGGRFRLLVAGNQSRAQNEANNGVEREPWHSYRP